MEKTDKEEAKELGEMMKGIHKEGQKKLQEAIDKFDKEVNEIGFGKYVLMIGGIIKTCKISAVEMIGIGEMIKMSGNGRLQTPEAKVAALLSDEVVDTIINKIEERDKERRKNNGRVGP